MDIYRVQPALTTLLMTQRKHNKDYSWPSQLKILENINKYQHISKSLRTLNYWFANAQAGKYLIRRRRIKRDPVHGMIFKSTLYKITIKGYRALASMGVMVADEIRRCMLWLKGSTPPPRRYGMNIARASGPDRDAPLQVRKLILESLSSC